MLVRHTMTKDPFTVAPGDSCLEVLRSMRSRGFRHAPVVDKGLLVGLVSERDLLRALPHLVGSFEGEEGRRALASPVRSVMAHAPVSCAPSDPVDVVARRMLDECLGCMTVVADGELQGIVTTTDALRGFTDHLVGHDAAAMTLLWTRGSADDAPDVGSMVSAAGMRLCAYFETETSTGALAMMVRANGDDAQLGRFRVACVESGLLLMATSRAA